MSILSSMIGQTVRLYPGDTYKKTAKVIAVDETGVLFEIVSSACDTWVVGQQRYISHSTNLAFETI